MVSAAGGWLQTAHPLSLDQFPGTFVETARMSEELCPPTQSLIQAQGLLLRNRETSPMGSFINSLEPGKRARLRTIPQTQVFGLVLGPEWTTSRLAGGLTLARISRGSGYGGRARGQTPRRAWSSRSRVDDSCWAHCCPKGSLRFGVGNELTCPFNACSHVTTLPKKLK